MMITIQTTRKNRENRRYLKTEYIDAVDKIEAERGFSLAKRKFGLGIIMTKPDSTSRSSIALSIIAMNLHRLTAFSFVNFLICLLFRIKRLLPGREAVSGSYSQPVFC